MSDMDIMFGIRNYVNYQIGLYGDSAGFGCVVAGIDDDGVIGIYEYFHSAICSVDLMVKNLALYSSKYRTHNPNINPLPFLISALSSSGFYPHPVSVTMEDSFFKINTLVGDKKLVCAEEFESDFLQDAKTFKPDEVCYRLNALTLAMVDIDAGRWLENLNEGMRGLFS